MYYINNNVRVNEIRRHNEDLPEGNLFPNTIITNFLRVLVFRGIFYTTTLIHVNVLTIAK